MPDFVEHKKFENDDSNGNASLHKFIELTIDEMKTKGATYFRVSHPPDYNYDIYVEGWFIKPNDQGPPPWQ